LPPQDYAVDDVRFLIPVAKSQLRRSTLTSAPDDSSFQLALDYCESQVPELRDQVGQKVGGTLAGSA
jgi:hypothetical protein